MEVGPEWSLDTTEHTIGKGLHSSTLSTESTAFCRKEILERTQQGFSIALLVTENTALFGTELRIYRLVSVYQVNCKPCLIYNYRMDPEADTTSGNASTDKVTPPKAM